MGTVYFSHLKNALKALILENIETYFLRKLQQKKAQTQRLIKKTVFNSS